MDVCMHVSTYTECFGNIDIILKLILIQMISNFTSMYRNNSRFYGQCFIYFFFSGIETPFSRKEKVFKY